MAGCSGFDPWFVMGEVTVLCGTQLSCGLAPLGCGWLPEAPHCCLLGPRGLSEGNDQLAGNSYSSAARHFLSRLVTLVELVVVGAFRKKTPISGMDASWPFFFFL